MGGVSKYIEYQVCQSVILRKYLIRSRVAHGMSKRGGLLIKASEAFLGKRSETAYVSLCYKILMFSLCYKIMYVGKQAN